MKKEMQVKRKHHFVWSHYLKNWQQEKKISYINSKGNIFILNMGKPINILNLAKNLGKIN